MCLITSQWPRTVIVNPNTIESWEKRPDGTWSIVVKIGEDIVDCTGVRRLTDAEQIEALKRENADLKKKLNEH